MLINILLEIATAVGRFFINPLVYVALLASIWLGYRRVKGERRFFHMRLLNGWSEVKSFAYITAGTVLISLLVVAIGLTLPVDFLLAVTACTIIALICSLYVLLSPAILLTAAFAATVGLFYSGATWQLFSYEITGASYTSGFAVSVAALIGFLLIVESQLLGRDGASFASPKQEKTKRGLRAIAYRTRKVIVVPLLCLVPHDVLSLHTPWWPQITLGASGLSLVLFPFVIGFSQKARKTLPVYLYPKLQRTVLQMAIIAFVIAVGAYFEPFIAIIGLPLLAAWRLFASVYVAAKEKRGLHAVVPSEKGVMIIAVLPESPAEKMGLVAGEIIKRVNGQAVYDERELYEALQINAAHCRLEVLDHQLEIRLTQHVVHNNDNHQIGIITFK